MSRVINNLIVHHSLSHWGTGAVVVKWHTDPKPKGNGWINPGYHAVICNGFDSYQAYKSNIRTPGVDGRCDRIHSEKLVANGCKGANADALHVCLIGNIDEYEPTPQQFARLIGLLVYWCKHYGLDPHRSIWGHGEMQKRLGNSHIKTCPGKMIDMDKIRNAVSLLINNTKG